MQIIGAADEFWRLRLTRVDTTDELDIEWRDDILYRQPNSTEATELEQWHVEAVRIEDYDSIVRIATFSDRGSAETFFESAKEDLTEMTKTQFEEAYLTPASTDSDDIEA